MKSICIITTRHISYNPRVLKEADALFNRGYEVTVVTVNNHSEQYKFDKELMETRKWTLKTINYRKENRKEKFNWIQLSIVQRIYALFSSLSFHYGIAERASLKGFGKLQELAKTVKADFYLVHHPEALAIGRKVSLLNNSKFGFDAEDFHSAMNETGQVSKEEKLISFLEKKYLLFCSYFTAASKGIGEAYSSKYGVKDSRVVLNVFPKEIVGSPGIGRPTRFYWYSQTIGPNRSLETLMNAAASIKEPFELHIRGSFHNETYKNGLLKLIDDLGIKEKVVFHPPILAECIIKDASQFDVGLALESNVSINRNICVTNKIFSYLMSGLAIVGTNTIGQVDIFSHFDTAVGLCQMDDVSDLAKAMQEFINNPERLMLAKIAARKAADERFNWEYESAKLLSYIDETILEQEQSSLQCPI